MTSSVRTVSLKIQGDEVEAQEGQSLLEVIRAQGHQVPSLCHHPGIRPYGACRVCLVEVKKGQKTQLTTSCNYPVQPGLEVTLDTERVVRHRRMVLELLLAMAPDAAPIRDLAREHGVALSRFPQSPKPPQLDNCILCGLCARVCREVVGAEALSLAGRGMRRYLESQPFAELPEACIGCGACAHVCPTSAISMEPLIVARWKSRWGEERPCRYALMKLTPQAVCENNYECARCEVDQWMVEQARGEHPIFLRKPARAPEVLS